MARWWLIVSAVALTSMLIRADEPQSTETRIEMTVHPSKAPQPALKYKLLPEYREMSTGNPILGYMLCFMEQNHFYFNKQVVEDREKWQTIPLKELPLGQMASYGEGSFWHADQAARMDTTDWQIRQRMKRDGANTLIPEVQQLRMLAGALKVRLRARIAEGNFDNAMTGFKTIFALSRHLGEHPTFIANLVGLAIAQIGIGPLEEMLQQQGSPNLYWAFTDLPTPLVGIQRGGQSDWLFVTDAFSTYFDDHVMSEFEIQKAMQATERLFRFAVGPDGKPPVKPKDHIAKQSADAAYLAAARKRLADYGVSAKLVGQFPAAQVVLLDEKRDFEVRHDEVSRAINLPYWQAEQYDFFGDKGISPALIYGNVTDNPTMFSIFLSSAGKIRRAQVRVEQRLGLLRTIEAIRMHAASHGGMLPKSLEDIKLPLGVDPFGGKPFKYLVEDGVAHLRGAAPKGEEKTAAFNLHYVIRIAN